MDVYRWDDPRRVNHGSTYYSLHRKHMIYSLLLAISLAPIQNKKKRTVC